MGGQLFAVMFGLPSLLNEFLQDELELNDPQNVVNHLVREHLPLEYPHFPYCMHSDKEELQRCITLREFLNRRVKVVLYRECPTASCDGLFPVSLVVSAALDILQNIDEKQIEILLFSSFSSMGWVESETPEKRYSNLMSLIEEASADPSGQREKNGTTIFEYCSEENLRLEALIDINKIPKSKIDPKSLCLIEFKYWIEHQYLCSKENLNPSSSTTSQYFKKGRLIESKLSESLHKYILFRENLLNGKRRQPSYLDVLERAVLSKALEIKGQGGFSATKFTKDYYQGILKQHGYKRRKSPKGVEKWSRRNAEGALEEAAMHSTVQRKWLTKTNFVPSHEVSTGAIPRI